MLITTKYAALRAFVILMVLTAAPTFLRAQVNETFNLTADKLENGKTVELNNAGWVFRAGDEANWANPNFDDSAWERLDDSALAIDKLSQTNWRGIGWFRLRVQIPSELADEQLALRMWQWGASEVYLDGKLIHRFGTVGANADSEQAYNPNGFPIGVSFGASGEHLIAVRHSVMAYQNLSSSQTQWLAKLERQFSITSYDIYYGAGFKMALTASNSIFAPKQTLLTTASENGLLKSGLVGGFGLLFLLLYFFYPRERSALFFALFSLGFCITYLTSVLIEVSSYDVAEFAIPALINFNFYSLTMLFLLLFLYSAFSFRLSIYFWLTAATVIAQIISSVMGEASITGYITAAAEFFLFLDLLRVMIGAFRQKKDGSWLLNIGVLFYLPTLLYYALTDSGTIAKLPNFHSNIQYGLVAIFIAISIYLARQFARTNHSLEAKLVEVERLSAKELEQTRLANDLALEREQEKTRFAIVEAENERRAKELEEARQLQLSMLPKKLPNIEGLEIAAYMKPATEVGGDYYDFHVGEDGTLTVAVGDATGHGLKAGSVVTATKSLFNAFAKHDRHSADSSKQMSRRVETNESARTCLWR